MQIEIWSDIMCPFCYIGKHHFEKALAQLSFQNELTIIYRSYQLNPDYYHLENDTVYSMLSRTKGLPIEQAKEMTKQVQAMAANAGLKINFDSNVPANTKKAHELIHFASKYNLGSIVKEKLFEAHFVEGLNVEDLAVLLQIAEASNLDVSLAEQALKEGRETYAVNQDLQEARNIGIRGVPFFLFDRKYAVSGAQPTDAFVEVLEKSFSEWKQHATSFKIISDSENKLSCDDEGCKI